MYKVYLSVLKEKDGKTKSIQPEGYIEYDILEIIKTKLINENQYVIYKSKPQMSIENVVNDSNGVAPNIHVIVSTNYKENKGINVYTKEGCNISNGFAKEIYKNLIPLYYKKDIDNGILYDDKKEEIMRLNSPAVLIELGNKNNIEDINWINKNKNTIGEKIAEGVIKGIKLRPC